MTRGNWIEDEDEDEDEEISSISDILKGVFGKNFEKASIRQKLSLLETAAQTARCDSLWELSVFVAADPRTTNLHFPETFDDTQEAMRLIKDLTEAISRDLAFHDLPIRGF